MIMMTRAILPPRRQPPPTRTACPSPDAMALALLPSWSGDLARVDAGEVSTTRHSLVRQLLCACVTKKERGDACNRRERGQKVDERGNDTVVKSDGESEFVESQKKKNLYLTREAQGIRLAQDGPKQLMKENRFCGGVVSTGPYATCREHTDGTTPEKVG